MIGTRSARAAPALTTVLLAASALLASCGVLRSAAETPGRVAGAVMPNRAPAPPSADAVFDDLSRYGDMILFRIDEASREFELQVATSEAELVASRWRLDSLRWVTQLGAGTNSIGAILDLVILTTTASWIQEDYWMPRLGEPALPMTRAMQNCAQDGWRLLERYLTPPQIEEARAAVAQFRAENPKIERDQLLHFPSFRALAEGRRAAGSGSLLGMVGLDPLSGLEPAAREIEQMRRFGQRTLLFLQRSPRLIGAEIEYRLLHVRESAEVRQLLANAADITASLESFSATAAALPQALSSEREAALQQVAAELTAQREGLLRDLEQASAPLEGLLAQAEGTLTAGKEMSAELAVAVGALDAFIGGFEEDEPAGGAAAPVAAPEEPAGRPFDVTEYGVAAERVGLAASELTALVNALEQRLPEAQRLLDEAAARGAATIDRATRNLLLCGLALILAGSLAVVLVRRLGARPPA